MLVVSTQIMLATSDLDLSIKREAFLDLSLPHCAFAENALYMDLILCMSSRGSSPS